MAEDVTVAGVEDRATGLGKVLERIGPRFARSEPRARAGVYVRGWLSAAERKNGWTLAESRVAPARVLVRLAVVENGELGLTSCDETSAGLLVEQLALQ